MKWEVVKRAMRLKQLHPEPAMPWSPLTKRERKAARKAFKRYQKRVRQLDKERGCV